MSRPSGLANSNDSVNGNWVYTYDDFSRLATSNLNAGQQTFNYQYDRFGNRWQQNAPQGGPAPQYNFDANNHVTPSSGVVYDAAGNITNDGLGHSFGYDAENRIVSVGGNSTASYVYDPDGRRVQAVANSNTVDFIYDQAGRAITEVTPGSWARSELYAGAHVATYASGTTFFDHSDSLGTARALSTVSGGVYQDCSSLPFGDGQTCTGNPWYQLLFTGDEHDNETNLEHTMFRQLTTTEGRWLSPDPAGVAAVDPTNPQTWNRYAYVMNSPTSFTDPLGTDPQAYCYFGDGPTIGIDGHPRDLSQECGRQSKGPNCLLDGGEIDCGLVQMALHSGAAAVCPPGGACIYNANGLFQHQNTGDDGSCNRATMSAEVESSSWCRSSCCWPSSFARIRSRMISSAAPL